MFILALRNILRNRRRTFMTLFLVISGTFLLSALRFFAYGVTQEMISRAVRLDSGLVEIAAFGWKDRPTLYRALEVEDEFLQSLESVGSGGISPRIKGGALLNYGERTRFVSVLAADQKNEEKITTLQDTIQEGRVPENIAVQSSGENVYEAMVGDRLARALGLSLDSRFFLIASQFDGSLGAVALRVTGIFRSGQSSLDASRIVISMDSGERLFGTRTEGGTYYTSIAIGTKNFLEAAEVKKQLQNRFGVVEDPDGLPPAESSVFDPVVLDWMDLNPGVVEMTTMATKKMDIYLLFFVVSISFGILNTVQMSIQERMREFGVLLAIGTGTRQVTWMLVWEVFLLIVPGVILGVTISTLLAIYLNHHPVDFSGTLMGETYRSIGLTPQIKPIVSVGELLKISLSLILPAFAVGFFATGRVRKLNPVEVIQTL